MFICDKNTFIKKYIKVLNYVASAMEINKHHCRIYHIDYVRSLGKIILHTDHLYVSIGNNTRMFINPATEKFLYRWCRDISDPTGGPDKYMFLDSFHDPQKILKAFFGVIQDKIFYVSR